MKPNTETVWHNLRPITDPCPETHEAQRILNDADEWLTDLALGGTYFAQMFDEWAVEVAHEVYLYRQRPTADEPCLAIVAVTVDTDSVDPGDRTRTTVQRVEVRRV